MTNFYTYPLRERELSLAEFAWHVATAMEPLATWFRNPSVDQRVIPTIIPFDDGNLVADIESAKKELEEIKAWSAEEVATRNRQYFENSTNSSESTTSRRIGLAARYKAMLEQVRGWQPPSPVHENLQNRMREELSWALQNEFGPLVPPAPITDAQYHEEMIEAAKDLLAARERRLVQARQEAAASNAWLASLVESLGPPPERRA